MKCVHLDFHTSPNIEGIGEKFNKEEFTKTLKDAHVDLITVFAKCHHGYTYYPSKVSTMHPHLKFNLLKEQVDACRSAGIKAPIYITMGWSQKDAYEHPEWQHVDFWTKKPVRFGTVPTPDMDPETPLYDCSWATLCPVGGYSEHLKAITEEVCQNFDVSDGVFYDICFMKDACVCDACKAGMIERGLNPDDYEDARKYYRQKRIEFFTKLNEIVHKYNKDAHIFYNGGADMNRPEYGVVQSHFELEDLPTAWGGYDFMPIRAKYFEKFGKFYLGMTGKFHHAWGEFGGFKNKEALRYECADMVSIGASISVGDHLHPNGLIDKSTYAIIGHAFDYVTKIEKYSENTKAYTDVAIWMSHNTDADLGASKLLQIMHLEFDVVESGDDLSKYNLVILPDKVKLTEEDKKALLQYTQRGGKILCSYESGFEEIGIEKIEPSKYDIDYIECPIDEVTTPFLSYASAYKTKCKGEVLATVREPYFSRTAGHFCGHKNTPFKDETAEYPALVKSENVLYLAHPIFSSYNSTGNYILQKYIIKAIESFYDKALKVDNFYSCGRVRLRKSTDKQFYALHLLYAPPVNRGNVCLLEDFPKVSGIEISIKIPENVKSVTVPVTGESISFKQENGILSFTVDNLELHKLVVINY